MQMLRPGEHTRAHRHTGSYLYHVAKGQGHSVINGRRYDWRERDIFCVPSWAWHEHVNASASRRRLPVLPVRPAGHAGAGLYREQAFGEGGGHHP
jgi:gentisate 1,2-dioxygenase